MAPLGMFAPVPPKASRSESLMADVIFLALGVGVFVAFAVYAQLLKRA